MSITMDEFDFDQEREAETIIHNSERKEAKVNKAQYTRNGVLKKEGSVSRGFRRQLGMFERSQSQINMGDEGSSPFLVILAHPSTVIPHEAHLC